MRGHGPGCHTVMLEVDYKLTMEGIVKAFLDQGPPWIGDSAFGDKADVKKAGARWDGGSKKWKAPDEPTLIALISEGKWRPVGHDSTFGSEVVRYIRRRTQAAELAEQKKREAARKSKEHTQAQKSCTARNDLMIPPDEPHLLAEALKHGVDQALVTSTGAFAHLGPRSGISDASRLFRGFDLDLLTWESLKNGEAARVGQDKSNQKRSSTGKGNKRGKGVKRGTGSFRGTSGVFAQSMSTGVAKTKDLSDPVVVKQRKMVRYVVTYMYTAKCDRCDTTLDSREQFGLECGCSTGVFQWHSCGRCCMPKREAGHCNPCAQRLEEIKQEEEALNSNS